MKNIYINGETGFIKILITEQRVEIKSSGFSANGKLVLNNAELLKMKQELQKCIECTPEEYYKVLYSINNNLFGFELRCDGENNMVYLLGVYSEDEKEEHRIEFEFDIRKENIKKTISDIENAL